MSILMPETNNSAVKKFEQNNDTDVDVLFENHDITRSMEMLRDGEVDGLIIGADHTSAQVIHEGLRTIGSSEKFVSSFFIMRKNEEELFFADCAVNPNPDSEKLAKIAYQTCVNVKKLGYEPTVAFLSFSTSGSADHEMVDKVIEASALFHVQHPEFLSYGEIQFDAAYDEGVFEKKVGGKFISKPNVFVFPDLNSANIAYKITQRLAGYTAIGPILQGFDRPLFDLSRGVDDIALKEIVKIANKLIDYKEL
jgi:phosphate acetyltransferase